jgi:hypothetical protein
LELQWNGTKLTDAETMLEWAKNMTWKGMRPVVELSRKAYAKGISLGGVFPFFRSGLQQSKV